MNDKGGENPADLVTDFGHAFMIATFFCLFVCY
jgi:hypothetical protein